MLAAGMMHVDICRVLDITEPTLQKYYRAELDSGGSKANAAVVATLFKLAVSGKCPAATFFFLKTRMRWRETSPQPIDDHEVRPTRVEVSWKDPDPPPPTDKVEYLLS